MIPCYICGTDASTVWIKGFVPAPDSQKLALCAEHDTPENRLKVVKSWHELLEHDMAVLTEIAKYKVAAPLLKTTNVHFTGGGMLSFMCIDCTPTQQGTLCITTPDNAQTFIPMQHVREYTVRPYLPETEKNNPRSVSLARTTKESLSFPASNTSPFEALPQEDGSKKPM